MTAQNGENQKSSAEIRAEIQQKRHEMSEKIDTIQDRISPQAIKEQAQDAVYSAVNDGADALVSYVRDNSGDLGTTIVDAVKRNPVPAALVGLGLGWLLIESMGGSDDRYSDRHYDERYADNNRGVQYPPQRYRETPRAQYAGRGYHSSEVGHYWEQGASSETNGTNASLAESASQVATEAGETVQQLWDDAKESAEQAKATVDTRVQTISEQTQSAVSSVAEQAEQFATQARNQTQEWHEQSRDQARYWGRETQRQAQRTGEQIQQTINDNPIAFGALALGIGAAIGLLLPATRVEDDLMGETRDQLLDSAQTVAQDVSERAQKVAEEIAPELQATAEKVIEDVKRAGQEATETVQESLQNVKSTSEKSGREAIDEAKATIDKAGDKAAQEAEKAKQVAKAEVQQVKETAKEDVSSNT